MYPWDSEEASFTPSKRYPTQFNPPKSCCELGCPCFLDHILVARGDLICVQVMALARGCAVVVGTWEDCCFVFHFPKENAMQPPGGFATSYLGVKKKSRALP